MRMRALFPSPVGSGLLAAALVACGHAYGASAAGTSPNPVPDVFECVKTQLKAIGNDLEKLSSDAKTQFAPQITEVKKQATELKTTLEAATASPSEETISAARRNVGELKNAFLDLQAALQATC